MENSPQSHDENEEVLPELNQPGEEASAARSCLMILLVIVVVIVALTIYLVATIVK